MAFLEGGEALTDDDLCMEKLSSAFSGGTEIGGNVYGTKNFSYSLGTCSTSNIAFNTYANNLNAGVDLNFYPDGKFEIDYVEGETNQTTKFVCQLLINAFGTDVVTESDCYDN